MRQLIKSMLQRKLFRFNYNSDVGFLHMLSKRSTNFDVLIDIGAYKGEYTKEFTKSFRPERVVLFEAQKDKYLKLQRMFPKYEVINAVLSNYNKEVIFYNYESGSSYKKEIGQPDNVVEEKCITKTLDQCLDYRDFIDKKVFLKIDTQGSELEILQNQKELLRLVEMVQCEISVDSYNEDSPSQFEYIEFFHARGFLIADVVYAYRDRNGTTVQMDMIFRRK